MADLIGEGQAQHMNTRKFIDAVIVVAHRVSNSIKLRNCNRYHADGDWLSARPIVSFSKNVDSPVDYVELLIDCIGKK